MSHHFLCGLILFAGCRSSTGDPRAPDGRAAFRLGYMANITHAPALWVLESGALQRALGQGIALEPKAFNAGPLIIEALFAGVLDAAYIGPNPAVNGFQKSRGTALRVVAGATQGGAELVVAPEIASPEQLAGRRIATPQLGNTQDVALRVWLGARKIKAEVVPVANADALSLFARREIAGAWVPEPWASRMVLEAGGRVLVDERAHWTEGKFATALVIVASTTLEKRSEMVRQLWNANAEAVRALSEPSARALVATRLAKELGKPLPEAVVARAFSQLSFSTEILEPQMKQAAEQAKALGFLASADIIGLFDRRFAAGGALRDRLLVRPAANVNTARPR